jgi:hypothetical protein
MTKHQRDLLRLGARYGFTKMEHTGTTHLALIHPTRGRVICPATPSDKRWVRNVEAELRRAVRA